MIGFRVCLTLGLSLCGQVCLDEARSSYPAEIVVELPSNTVEDMESNVERAKAWAAAWRPAQ